MPQLAAHFLDNTSFAFPKGPGHRSLNASMRNGDWKLLVNADGTRAEMYDLATDRTERTNLIAEKPDIARRLIEVALAWRKSLP